MEQQLCNYYCQLCLVSGAQTRHSWLQVTGKQLRQILFRLCAAWRTGESFVATIKTTLISDDRLQVKCISLMSVHSFSSTKMTVWVIAESALLIRTTHNYCSWTEHHWKNAGTQGDSEAPSELQIPRWMPL